MLQVEVGLSLSKLATTATANSCCEQLSFWKVSKECCPAQWCTFGTWNWLLGHGWGNSNCNLLDLFGTSKDSRSFSCKVDPPLAVASQCGSLMMADDGGLKRMSWKYLLYFAVACDQTCATLRNHWIVSNCFCYVLLVHSQRPSGWTHVLLSGTASPGAPAWCDFAQPARHHDTTWTAFCREAGD